MFTCGFAMSLRDRCPVVRAEFLLLEIILCTQLSHLSEYFLSRRILGRWWSEGALVREGGAWQAQCGWRLPGLSLAFKQSDALKMARVNVRVCLHQGLHLCTLAIYIYFSRYFVSFGYFSSCMFCIFLKLTFKSHRHEQYFSCVFCKQVSSVYFFSQYMFLYGSCKFFQPNLPRLLLFSILVI